MKQNFPIGSLEVPNNGAPTSPAAISVGKVIDIILSEDHDYYSVKGEAKALYGIFYSDYNESSTADDPTDRSQFAYCGLSSLKTIPVPGELVVIQSLPTFNVVDSSQYTPATYYTAIVPVFNHPTSNEYLDTGTKENILDVTRGGEFETPSFVNPLKANVGDVFITGRQGQSIRFSGATGTANVNIDSSNIGKPITYISNSQATTEDGFTAIAEDINEDGSSIYLVEDHQVNLKQVNLKRDSYDEAPTTFNQYKGRQILSTSGRIALNATEDSILLSGKESIGLNARTVNLDSEDYLCLDSKRIYLGSKVRTSPEANREAVLLGNQVEIFLETLLNMLSDLSKDLLKAKTSKGDPIPRLIARGSAMQGTIRALQNQVNSQGKSPLKSKKVFTE